MMSETTATTHPNEPLKRISIICAGSRGDFQPYLALAVALKEKGYHVRMLSNIAYKSFAKEFGIDFVVIWEQDFDKLLKGDKNLMESMATGNMLLLMEFAKQNAIEEAPAITRNFMEEMKENRPDMVIEGTAGVYFGLYAEHVLGIPVKKVMLQSLVFNPDRAPIGLPTLPDGGHYDIIMGIFSGIYDSFIHYDNAMEAITASRLEPIYPKSAFMSYMEKMVNCRGDTEEVIICQSPLFKKIIAGTDSPVLNYVGPSVLNATQQKEHHTADVFGGDDAWDNIDTFINSNPDRQPVYCGWGSMVCKSPAFMVEFVARALQHSGERGIVLGGWANLSQELLEESVRTSDCDEKDVNDLLSYAKDNILFVPAASHENLFPRMKCIIHHGGSGTTNASLRSGRPTIITPVFADQFDHALVVNELGVGVGFDTSQFQKIAAEELGEAIRKVVNSEEIQRKAMEVGELVSQENGCQSAVKVIERYWSGLQQTN